MEKISKGKVTKSCARCRKHKTRCDSIIRNPLPCSSCAKRNLECFLDIISSNPKRTSNDVLEKLDMEVNSLKESVDHLIYKKSILINLLIKQNPSISEIQNCLELDDYDIKDEELSSSSGDFSISSDVSVAPVSLTKDEVTFHFDNYFKNYHRFLPILPDSLYKEANVNQIYDESKLLFWCIVLTSHLNTDNSKQYLNLSKHVKKLVVEMCWLNTPRSVYVLCSLLVLTTWPIPLSPKEKMNDNLSIKYLSLMRNLSLQLGLHRLEFINEFSHKTNMTITKEINMNNLIRERIYKFITVNSNYWLINLGLLHLNFNGFQEDYVINKATSMNQNTADISEEDRYINSLLKVSIVQQRLHENLNNNNQMQSKLISLNMFEVILNDLKKDTSAISKDNLIELSVEYSKLQLYLYSLDSSLKLSLNDYRVFIYKTLTSCYRVIDLFTNEFPNLYSINQLPIHYKFIVELVSLILERIFYTPLLKSVEDYEILKSKFKTIHLLITKNNESNWNFFNSRLLKIIAKYNEILGHNLLGFIKDSKSLYILTKFNTHQVANMNYEMTWSIYSSTKGKTNFNDFNDREITWDAFGIKDKQLIEYLDNISLV
ncbi:Transcription factor [Yamadazyma tenuis]|nr:Transcription factor [Yamadazyma tenuis]